MTDPSPQGRCPSCAVAAGEVPAHIVTETPAFLAFLEPDPIRRGHLQVSPRAHFACFNALPDVLARDLLLLAEHLTSAQRRIFRVDRVGFLFPAEAVSHACVHLVPLLSAGDIASRRFGAAVKAVDDAESKPINLDLARTARSLRGGLLGTEGMGAMP